MLTCDLHTAHFLSADPKHLSAHAWQNLECPQGTKITLALSALQQMSRRLSESEVVCADEDGEELCK